MKKFIVIAVLSVFSFNVDAQLFNGGLMLGVCGSQIDGDEQGGYKKPGLIAGASTVTLKSVPSRCCSLLVTEFAGDRPKRAALQRSEARRPSIARDCQSLVSE